MGSLSDSFQQTDVIYVKVDTLLEATELVVDMNDKSTGHMHSLASVPRSSSCSNLSLLPLMR